MPDRVRVALVNDYELVLRNRVDAVLWGTDHGFPPDHRSVDRTASP